MDAPNLKPTLRAVLRTFTRARPPRSVRAAAAMLRRSPRTVQRARGVLHMLGLIEKHSTKPCPCKNRVTP